MCRIRSCVCVFVFVRVFVSVRVFVFVRVFGFVRVFVFVDEFVVFVGEFVAFVGVFVLIRVFVSVRVFVDRSQDPFTRVRPTESKNKNRPHQNIPHSQRQETASQGRPASAEAEDYREVFEE